MTVPPAPLIHQQSEKSFKLLWNLIYKVLQRKGLGIARRSPPSWCGKGAERVFTAL
jgi:hypothetical protein